VTEEFDKEPVFTEIDHKKPPAMNPHTQKKMGRPSKYSDIYADKLIEFFNLDDYLELRGEHVTPSGKKVTELQKGVRFPTIEGYCVWAGIRKDTVYRWAKELGEDEETLKYPYFSDALGYAQEVQANLLINGGISGEYNLGLVKIILSARHDYLEQTKQEVEVLPVKIVIDQQDESA